MILKFGMKGDYLRMYTQYCANHENARMRLETLKKENIKFNKFLEVLPTRILFKVNFNPLRKCLITSSPIITQEKMNDPECRSLDLQAFLITPVQRICRYPLLLKVPPIQE